MNKLTSLLLLLASPAYSYELLQPTAITVEGEKYKNLRDPYIPEDTAKWIYGAALGTKISLLGNEKQGWRLFYDPELRFRSTTSQIRYGALYYETGGEVQTDERCYRVFARHLSEHVLERQRDSKSYPLLDSYVVQVQWKIK